MAAGTVHVVVDEGDFIVAHQPVWLDPCGGISAYSFMTSDSILLFGELGHYVSGELRTDSEADTSFFWRRFLFQGSFEQRKRSGIA